MRLLLALVAAAVVVPTALVAGSGALRRLLQPPAVATIMVEPGRFVRDVTATGTLKAVKATPIVVPTDVRMAQKVAWLAEDGRRVEEGEPIVLFDPTDMEKTLADGRADRDSAQSTIGKTLAESRKTAKSLSLDKDLARGELASAEEFALKDATIFSRNEIIESEIDRDLLKKRADAAEAKLEANAKLAAAELALGEIEKSKAEISIRQAEKGLGSLRILAPHDGFIVMERSWRGETVTVGETLWPGQKIAEIPNLSALEAKVHVLEADAGGLETGRKATLVIEGRPGVEYSATVSRVDAIAKSRTWRSPVKYFEAILTLEATDPEAMKPGQNVRARIRLEEIQEVISVPRGAVFERDGKRVVYREREDRFVPVEVKIGHNSLSHVVIEKGLEPGDRIALRDPARSASDIFQPGEGAAGISEAGGRKE